MEEMICRMLKETYGSVNAGVDKNERDLELSNALGVIDGAFEMFKDNPSARHYNLLLVTMLTFQYWKQKAVLE
jgi:hypothetical protein